MQKFASAVCSQTFSADRNLLGLLLLCYSTLISLLTFAKPASNFPISRCFQKSPNFQALSFSGILWDEISRGEGISDRHFLGLGLGCWFFLLLLHFTAVKMLWLTWCTARKIPRYHKPLWLSLCFNSKPCPAMAEVTAQSISDSPGLCKEMEP